MATKKKTINKSQFVRDMGDKTAAEVVAVAKKKGIKLTENYVYTIRSAAKKKGAPKAVRVSNGANGVVRSMRDEERALAHLILDVGLGRAQLVFDKLRAMAGA